MARMKNPPHPGRSVRRSMDSLGLSVEDAAAHLGIQRAYFSDVLGGMAGINADLAVRLAKAFGSTPEVWTRMQSEHDLAQIDPACIEVEFLEPETNSWNDFFAQAGIDISPREQPQSQAERPAWGDYAKPDVVIPRKSLCDFADPSDGMRGMLDAILGRLDALERKLGHGSNRLRLLPAPAQHPNKSDRAAPTPHLGVHVNAGHYDEEKLRYPHGRPRCKYYGCLSTEKHGTTRITIVDLPGCTAQGRTHGLALQAATLAAEEYVLRERAAGRVLPEPREMDDLFIDPAIERAQNEGAFLWHVRVDPDAPDRQAARAAILKRP